MSKNVLSVENVTMQFGGVVAVDNLNLEVNEGEIVALIGPNGAGKTTAFNVITGVYAPTNGRVRFNEACIVRNHPSGKMKKQYKGEHADMYTAQFAPEEALDDEALKAWKEGQKALDSYAFTDHVLAPTPDKITALG
ncbi:MAG: ATP-binding cassette domain-containing protein, partial [Firmicutes bacterium]|nr:ATP-binding cassette domain-containing protein [Bacillota bacterium]